MAMTNTSAVKTPTLARLFVTLVVGAGAISSTAVAHAGPAPAAPDFWPNVLIFDPSMRTNQIQATVDAIELNNRGIRVNGLSPGPIDTAIFESAPAERKEYFRSMIPRKELGRPEEIATVALFLASNDSSFVNGMELCVDGGISQT
jgi:hypothetical protein